MVFKKTIIVGLIVLFYLLHFYWNSYRGGEELSKSQELYIQIISILIVVIVIIFFKS